MKRHIAQLLQSLDLVDFIKNNAKKNVLFRSAYKFGAQRMIDYAYPQRMHIDPAGLCNLNCVMCAPRLTDKPMGFMKFDLFRTIIDEAATYGPRAFALCKDGEPLLNPEFPEMIAYIRNKNPKNVIALTTNGILLDAHKSSKLLQHGVDKITISIRAASAQTYQNICGCDEYARVVENVREFLRQRKAGGYTRPKVFVQFIPLKEARHEREEFVRTWQNEEVTLDMSGLFSWSGTVTDQDIARPQLARRYPCYELWFTPAINWNGDVSICSYDWDRSAIVGNVGEESLASIWNGDRMKQFRAMHLGGKSEAVPVCKECEIWAEYPDIWFWWQKK